MVKINLGCGTNKLEGWENHDADVDITKPLPWEDNSVDFVFAEHVVEHIGYDQAINFFAGCHRILKPQGVCRIAVPSVEQVWQLANSDYCTFTEKWVKPLSRSDADRRRGAMTNILAMHGHKAPWTQGLLKATLFYAGFAHTQDEYPGCSAHPELRRVEGHGLVIGEEYNLIETVVVEATK